MEIIHDSAADLSVLNGKTIAIMGYGAQGRAQSPSGVSSSFFCFDAYTFE